MARKGVCPRAAVEIGDEIIKNMFKGCCIYLEAFIKQWFIANRQVLSGLSKNVCDLIPASFPVCTYFSVLQVKTSRYIQQPYEGIKSKRCSVFRSHWIRVGCSSAREEKIIINENYRTKKIQGT
jgi:hypothetical protein